MDHHRGACGAWGFQIDLDGPLKMISSEIRAEGAASSFPEDFPARREPAPSVGGNPIPARLFEKNKVSRHAP